MTTKKNSKQTKKNAKVLTVKSQLKAGITIVGSDVQER